MITSLRYNLVQGLGTLPWCASHRHLIQNGLLMTAFVKVERTYQNIFFSKSSCCCCPPRINLYPTRSLCNTVVLLDPPRPETRLSKLSSKQFHWMGKENPFRRTLQCIILGEGSGFRKKKLPTDNRTTAFPTLWRIYRFVGKLAGFKRTM